MSTSIAVIGGGHAGDELLGLVRELGFRGEITLFDSSSYPAVERPALSKEFLATDMAPEALRRRAPSFYEASAIIDRTGDRVERVSSAQNVLTVTPASGEVWTGDAVVVASGMTPVRIPIPGSQEAPAYYLQSVEDAIRLRESLAVGASVVVIGGGFIGAEVAASLRTRGHPVAIIERGQRLMARAVSEEVSWVFHQAHRDAGVRLLLNTSVREIQSALESASTVITSEGESIPADVVVVAAGVEPNTGFLDPGEVSLERGFVVVDECGESSHPGLFAIGDVALFPHPFGGLARTPIPSIDNASWSALVVARALADEEAPPNRPVPTFWTEQYGLRVQIAGLSDTADQSVVRPGKTDGSFAVFHYARSRLVAVESVGSGRDYQAAKRALGVGINIPPDVSASAGIDLPAFVASVLG